MRFGRLLWAKKGETSRIQLFLVDKAYDEQKNGHGLDEPRSTNVAKSAALSASRFSALIALLVGKGVLSAEEAERIRTVEADALTKELWEHDRVRDLDDWLAVEP